MQRTMTVTFLALGWLLLMDHSGTLQAQEDADILEAPENVTVVLGQPPLNLTCRVRRMNVYMEIDGLLTTFANFLNRGLTISDVVHDNDGVGTLLVIMELIERNNNSQVACIGVDNDQENEIISALSFVTILGAPHPPSLQYSVINENTLEVSWEEPFAPESSPITRYFLQVVDTYQNMQNVLIYDELGPDSLSFNVTNMDATSCTNLVIEVWAENSFGNGTAAIVYGAFPTRPRDFLESPNIAVTFSIDFSPIININFMFPLLCPYNNATYVIQIKDAAQILVYNDGPISLHWMESGSNFSMVLRDIGLKIDAEYTFHISVSTLVGQVSNVSSFSTSSISSQTVGITTSTSIPPAKNPDLATVAAASIGGAVIVIVILIAMIMCIIYLARRTRRRKRECSHTTEYANGKGHVDSMVVNPIYERDPIYEEINPEDGYMSITAPTTLPSLKCNLEKSNDDYTTMNPAGTLRGQLAVNVGAAAVDTVDEGPCISNVNDEEGASAQCMGQQQKQDLEGRYTIR